MAVEIDGNDHDASFQAGRELAANHQLPLQTRGQAISFGQARRKVPVVCGIPAAHFVAIMAGEAVAATVVIVVAMISSLIPPMPVVVLVAVLIPAMSIAATVGERCAA